MDERVVELEAKVQSLEKKIQNIKIWVWQKFEEEIPEEILKSPIKEECHEETPTQIVKNERNSIIVSVPTISSPAPNPEETPTAPNDPNPDFILPHDLNSQDFNDGDFDEPLDHFDSPLEDDHVVDDDVMPSHVQKSSQIEEEKVDFNYIQRLCSGRTESESNLIQNCFKTSLIIKLSRLPSSDTIFKRNVIPRTSKNSRSRKQRSTRSRRKRNTVICPTPNCSQKFSRHDLRAHLEAIHPEFQINSSCKYCSSVFKNPNSLSAHLRQVHAHDPSIPHPYKCFLCSRGFEMVYTYRKHLEAHSQDPKYENLKGGIDQELQNLELNNSKGSDEAISLPSRGRKKLIRICGTCGERFHNKMMFHTHEKKKHPELFIHHCDQCSNTFKTEQNYNRHLGKVHGVGPMVGMPALEKKKKKPKGEPSSNEMALCPVCGRSMCMWRMKHHIQYHHETPRSFKCPEEGCGWAFNELHHLNSHVAIVHCSLEERKKAKDQTKAKKIACVTCGVLVNPIIMDRHVRLKHEKGVGGLVCGIGGCERTFAYKYILWEHYRVHMNQRRKEYSEEFTRDCPEEIKKFLERRRESVKKYATKYNAKKKEEKCLERKKK